MNIINNLYKINPFFIGRKYNIVLIKNFQYFVMKNIKWIYKYIYPKNGTMEDDIAYCRRMFNDIGFHWGMGKIGRLIGFGKDKWDYYYIVKYPNNKIVWESMVGGFCTLKGRIPKLDYINLESCYNLSIPKEKEFHIKDEDNNGKKNGMS